MLSWAEVAGALGKSPDAAVPGLERQRTQAESEPLALCCTYALCLFGKEHELERLLSFLNSDDFHVRCMTLSLLEELRSEASKTQIRDSLTRLLQSETHPAVRERAESLRKQLS